MRPEQKTERLFLRLTLREKQKLMKRAKETGLSLSDWVRRRLLGVKR